jgi:hypothetical protein
MARSIQFFPTQMNMGGDVYSQIVDVTDVSRLDVELRVYAVSGGASGIVTMYTTSDPALDNNGWVALSTSPAAITGTAVTGYTGAVSGFGRFVRAKLNVNTNACITACLNAVGRDV